MPGLNDTARAHDPDPQFVITFLSHLFSTTNPPSSRKWRDYGATSRHEYTRIGCSVTPFVSIRVYSWLDRLTIQSWAASCAPLIFTDMSKVCTITGSRPTRGSVIHRR